MEKLALDFILFKKLERGKGEQVIMWDSRACKVFGSTVGLQGLGRILPEEYLVMGHAKEKNNLCVFTGF